MRRRNPHVTLHVTEKELAVISTALRKNYGSIETLHYKLGEAHKEMQHAKRVANREAKMKRLRGARANGIEKTPESYPPDPVWGRDRHGRFSYTDYDGESLMLRFEENGDVWADKLGEGPVYIRSEDVPVILAALMMRG